jgi:hypothetical protein
VGNGNGNGHRADPRSAEAPTEEVAALGAAPARKRAGGPAKPEADPERQPDARLADP